jgi:hypothetical protein
MTTTKGKTPAQSAVPANQFKIRKAAQLFTKKRKLDGLDPTKTGRDGTGCGHLEELDEGVLAEARLREALADLGRDLLRRARHCGGDGLDSGPETLD